MARLTAIDHHTRTASSAPSTISSNPPCGTTHTLYASPALRTSYDAVRLDTGTPLFMRAPGEALGQCGARIGDR